MCLIGLSKTPHKTLMSSVIEFKSIKLKKSQKFLIGVTKFSGGYHIKVPNFVLIK